jgi:hypothetical protein
MRRLALALQLLFLSAPSRAQDSGGEIRISKDFLLGSAALAVPGGGFLWWADPKLDHPFINTGTGTLLGLAAAAFGIKAYVEGDLALGLGIHGGSILLGYGGYRLAQGAPASRTASLPERRPGPLLTMSVRF